MADRSATISCGRNTCQTYHYGILKRTHLHMLKPLQVEAWVQSRRSDLDDVREPVEAIIRQVREGKDSALRDLTARFDGIEIEDFRVTEEEIEAAYDDINPELTERLIEAEARITQFHELQKRTGMWLQETEPGITLGVKTTALSRIGAYVPGGRAAYPSTALMTAVPARVAGVKEICCCTPPPIHPLTLVALDIAGVSEIYRLGGAQAIAAMALGTETIAPVQKIVGPGNIFVTAAKMMLRDHAEIDFPAGPSEIGIIADASAIPEYIAADILAQAEHDPKAACILVTTDPAIAEAASAEVARMFEQSPRQEIIGKALENSGYVLAETLDEAISLMNRIAPEHLSIQVADTFAVLSKIENAGSIFAGPFTAVACGDYASGTNHVLPTAGYARMYSGLNVDHFCKTSTIQMIDQEGLESIGDIVETLADAEGLHALSLIHI